MHRDIAVKIYCFIIMNYILLKDTNVQCAVKIYGDYSHSNLNDDRCYFRNWGMIVHALLRHSVTGD